MAQGAGASALPWIQSIRALPQMSPINGHSFPTGVLRLVSAWRRVCVSIREANVAAPANIKEDPYQGGRWASRSGRGRILVIAGGNFPGLISDTLRELRGGKGLHVGSPRAHERRDLFQSGHLVGDNCSISFSLHFVNLLGAVGGSAGDGSPTAQEEDSTLFQSPCGSPPRARQHF